MKRRIFIIFLSLLLIVGMISGCGSKEGKEPDTSGKPGGETADKSKDKTGDGEKEKVDDSNNGELEHVELDWYLALTKDYPDTPMVMDKLKELIKEELNTTVNIHINTYPDHTTKVSTMLNAGQPIDILFTSTSTVPFAENAQRGAFHPLEDLLEEYAPNIYKDIPKEAWEAVTVDGHIYAVVPMKDLADVYSVHYDEKFFEKYNIRAPESGSWISLYEWKDVFYKAHEARNTEYPDLADMPSFAVSHLRLETCSPYESIVPPVGITIPGIESFEGKGSGDIAFNVYDTPEYLEFCKFMREFVDKGVVPEDAPNFDPDKTIDLKTPWSIGQGHLVPITNKPEWETVGLSLSSEKRMIMTTGYVQAALNAISSKSENPERALMVLDLVNSDPYIGTVARFGIEDKHWKDKGEGFLTFEGTDNSDPKNWAYRHWYGGEWGSIVNMKVPEGTNPELQSKIKNLVNVCNKDTALGFVLDIKPVQNEIAACRNVIDEYDPLLKVGALPDVEKEVAEFVAKLKENGSEKIVDEVQKQLDGWRAATNK